MNIFYENLLDLCAKNHKTPSGVASAIGLSNAAASGWKKGKKPSDTTLAKLSEYFGISVAALIGENEQNNMPAPETQSEHDKTLEQLLNLVATLDSKDLEILTDMAKAIKERRDKRD